MVWATERRDVLSGFFYFLTIYAYVTADGAGQTYPRRLALSILFYAFSLLAKGTAMTLPAVLLLLDVYPLGRLPGTVSAWIKPDYRAILWEKLPYFSLAAVFALLALLGQESAGALRPVQQYFISYRIGQAFYALCFYFWKTLLPLQLSPLYELPFDFDAWMPLFYLCGFAALALTIVLYWLRRDWPALLASWLYYVIILAPLSGLVQSGSQLVADRYSYLSCLSLALLLGAGLSRIWASSVYGSGRSRFIEATAVVLLLALGVMSWRQSKIWHDTKTLWRYAIAVAPNSTVAHYNLGRTYEDGGVFAESLENYRRAVEINPANADAQYNLARLLAKNSMVTEAIAGYRRVLEIRPNDAEAHNNLGLLLGRQGDFEAAAEKFRLALKIDPKYGKAYFNLGRLLADRGEPEKALHSYQRALELDPNQPEILLAMAETLVQLRRLDDAAIQLQKVVLLKPDLPDAHTALARVLAAQGRKTEAEKHYQEALRLLKKQERPAN